MSRALLALALLAACGTAEVSTPEPAPEPAPVDAAAASPGARAAAIATALRANPAGADAILAAEGLDRAAFEALLLEVAHDPEQSRIYAAGVGE